MNFANEKLLRELIKSTLVKECWKTHKQVGMKKKGNRLVPNCVPKNEADSDDEEDVLSESLMYHVVRNVGTDKNIHRPGSTEFFRLFREARKFYRSGDYRPCSLNERALLNSDIGEFGIYNGSLVPLDYPIEYGNEEHLSEAKYKGKKVELNKPKRGSGGRAYVYVNSGKKNKDGTIRVKKVSFGSSMPDAMGDSKASRKRRKNFGDRHNCSDKNDKTKPGYWSCRATKFFGRDISGWW
jgi:hypothetical protein